jgi:hypothetical protein
MELEIALEKQINDKSIQDNTNIIDEKEELSVLKEVEAMNKSLLTTNIVSKENTSEEINKMNNLLVSPTNNNSTIEDKLPAHISKPSSLIEPIKEFWNDTVIELKGSDKDLPSLKNMYKNALGNTVINAMDRFHDDVLFTSENPFEEKRKQEDIGIIERWAEGMMTIGMDLPFYLVGGLIGKKVLPATSSFGTGFGAGYLTDSLRETYLKSLEKGDVDTFDEWWDVFLKEGHKAGFKSGLTFGVTAAAPGAIGAKGVLQTQGTILTSLLGMHTLFKGDLPSKDEFIDTTALVATFAGIQASAPKVRQLYKKANVEKKPVNQILEETITNETKLETFVSKNLDITKDQTKKTVEIEKINETTGEITQQTVEAKPLETTNKPIIEKTFFDKPLEKVSEKELFERFDELSKIVDKAEKPTETLTPELKKMLKEEGGGSAAFSRKRGYTEKEIAEYKEYTEIAMELDRRLGPDTAITREFDLQTTKEKVKKVKDKEVVDRPIETNNILDNIQLTDKDKPTRTISKIGQDAITYFSDGLHPLFVARKQFFKNGGTFDKIDPYKLARNYAGLESRILRFIEDSTLNGKTLASNGKPLMEIVDPVINKVEVRENFTAFAVSKRGLEKINQGKVLSSIEEVINKETGEVTTKTKGITKKDAQATVNKYENQIIEGTNKTYGEVFKELVEYQKRIVEFMVDSGVLDRKQADAMFSANKDFIPFYRVLEDQISGSESRVVGNPFKNFKGSDRIIKDPIESVFKNTWTIITATEKNRVNASFIDMIKQNPEAFPNITKAKNIKATKINPEDLAKIVDNPKHLNENAKDGFTFFTRSQSNKLNLGQIEFLKDGKREVWNVGKDIAEALDTLTRKQANTFVKILSTPSKLLRAGSVLNPDFVIASIERDTLGAGLHSKNFFKPFYSTVVGLSHVLKKTPEFKELVSSGGFQSMISSLDKNYFNKDVNKFAKQHKFRNQVKNPIEMLRVFSETYEASTRMGDYLLTKKRLRKKYPNRSEKDIIEMSGYNTRDLMDFAKIGNGVRDANRIYAFLNAQIRGGEKFIDSLVKRPGMFAAKTVAYVQLPTISLWLLNHDDPRYKKLTQLDKDLNWIFISGDGTVDEPEKYTVYRIRKPHDVGLLVGTGTEKTLDYLYKNNNKVDIEKSINEILGTFGDMYSFGIYPDAVRPLAENWANKSLYTSNPIYSARGEQIVPMLEYGPYTSETSKLIGEALYDLGIEKFSSPAQIDNIIKSYTGSLGRLSLLGADYLLQKTGVVDKIEMPDWELADYPIVKSFILGHPKGRSSFIQNFLERYEKDLPKINSYYKLIEDGQREKAENLFSDDLQKQLVLPIGELLIDMFSLVKFEVENKTASGEDKRKNINKIYDRMITISERGLEIYDQIDKRQEQ